MNQFYNRLRGVLLCAIVLLSVQSASVAQNAEDILDRLNERYSEIETLQAEFVQSMSSPYTSGTSTMRGTIILRGDKYRIETDQQTIVTDGITNWVYDRVEQQVIISDFEEDEASFSVSSFLINYPEEFDAEYLGDEMVNGTRHHLLRLVPRADNAFLLEVRLLVREDDSLVRRMQVVDVNETTMIFDLEDISINPPAAPDAFSFSPPEGTEIVDLRY